MNEPLDERFAIEDGALVRRVNPRRGTPYEHRCQMESYEAVAHTIDEMGSDRITLEELQARTRLPFTHVAVALAFMKERGVVVPAYARRSRAASESVHLDAMIEYWALAESTPESGAVRAPPLTSGTRVLNTLDGEPGSIVNGYGADKSSAWMRYEVETESGIEIWHRNDFIVIPEPSEPPERETP